MKGKQKMSVKIFLPVSRSFNSCNNLQGHTPLLVKIIDIMQLNLSICFMLFNDDSYMIVV